MRIPKSWKEVTIRKYLAMTDSIKFAKQEYDKEIGILSAICGVSDKEVESMKITDFVASLKKLYFLSELPGESIQWNFKLPSGRYAFVATAREMTAGQIIDFMEVAKDCKTDSDSLNNMHKLLACCMLKKKRGIFFRKGFITFNLREYVPFDKTCNEVYEHLSMNIAYPYYIFFWKVLTNLLPAMATYLKRETDKISRKMKRHRPKKGMDSTQNGVGS